MTTFAVLNVVKQLDVYGGPDQGTRYSMQDACAKCGTGAEQIGPLIVKNLEIPSVDVFCTLDREILISVRLKAILQDAGITCLWPVVDAHTGAELECAQLIPEAVLPLFSKDTTGYKISEQCAVCHRDGYFDVGRIEGRGRRIRVLTEPRELHYRGLSEGLLKKDLLATWERWGLSRLRDPFKDSVFAKPMYVAGSRLIDALKQANVEGLEFEPVFTDD